MWWAMYSVAEQYFHDAFLYFFRNICIIICGSFLPPPLPLPLPFILILLILLLLLSFFIVFSIFSILPFKEKGKERTIRVLL